MLPVGNLRSRRVPTPTVRVGCGFNDPWSGVVRARTRRARASLAGRKKIRVPEPEAELRFGVSNVSGTGSVRQRSSWCIASLAYFSSEALLTLTRVRLRWLPLEEQVTRSCT